MCKRKPDDDKPMTPKRMRTDLTLDQKREIINWVDQQTTKPSNQYVANQFKDKFGVNSLGRMDVDIYEQ